MLRIPMVDSASADAECASHQTSTASADTVRSALPAAQGFSAIGTWVGTYTCSQGLTGLTLTAPADDNDSLEGSIESSSPGCTSVHLSRART
jgi:hypothetical protein